MTIRTMWAIPSATIRRSSTRSSARRRSTWYEAGILDKSVIVITSDHGGIDKGHGGITMAEMRTPLIIWGKGVKKGWCFDDVPTVQQDVASVLADLLGVKLPDYCRGRSIGGIFE